MRFSLVTIAVVVLLTWLTLGRLRTKGPNPYVLQVPATYFSVGQRFQPRLVSLAANSAASSDSVTLELRSSGGLALATDPVSLAAAGTALAVPMSLPRAGSYELRATSAAGSQTITLRAMPEPPPDVGGVLPVVGLGVAPGVADYLRSHGFVFTPAGVSAPVPAATRIIVVGQPRLNGEHLADQYSWLWQQIAAGAQALLLEPPAPAVVPYWPLAPPLVAARTAEACGADSFAPPFTGGLAGGDDVSGLLRPRLLFDYSRDSTVALYHWDGRQILPARRGNDGYPACHALVSYRLGDGWVSQTTLPLLQHFQDVRARVVLMNLIVAVARRKHYAPASPGLAWVMRQRLKKLAQAPGPELGAVYYRNPPAAVESAPLLTPVTSAPGASSCWPVPASTRAGASFTLEFGAPQPLRTLTLAATSPPPLRLEASPDGRGWVQLPLPAAAASSVSVPPGSWQAFRLTASESASAWQLCRFSAQ
ncbi:MAG: hypothetical protein ACRD1C_02755 [Terriglobales bacterium]